MKNLITVIILLLITNTSYGCNSNNQTDNTTLNTVKDTTMKTEERFDFEDYKIRLENNKTSYMKDGGASIRLYVFNNNPLIIENLPSPSFIELQKHFHPNGALKEKSFNLGQGVFVGVREKYDENGYLIEKIDEDEKFGKVKPIDILRFMEKEELINLETGGGRFTHDGITTFKLSFTPNITENIEKDTTMWNIKIYPLPHNSYIETRYVIGGETGKVLEKVSRQRLPIE